MSNVPLDSFRGGVLLGQNFTGNENQTQPKKIKVLNPSENKLAVVKTEMQNT